SGRRAIKRFELFGEALGSKTTKIVFRWYSHLYKLPHRRCYSVLSVRLSGFNRVGALFLFNYGCTLHPYLIIPYISVGISAFRVDYKGIYLTNRSIHMMCASLLGVE